MRFSFPGTVAALAAIVALLCAAVARGSDFPGDEATEPAPIQSVFVRPRPSAARATDRQPPLRTIAFLADQPSVSESSGLDGDESGGDFFEPFDEEADWDDFDSRLSPVAYPNPGPDLSQLPPVGEPDPNFGGYAFVGYDSWRGLPDGAWGNNGIHTGVNVGSRLGQFSDWTGIGAQAGGSVGVYNWSGTDYRMSHQHAGQVQGFVTYGFFRKANESSRWSASIVQDWMFNSNYSVFGVDPTMSQFRAQIGYAFTAADELGIWGAWRATGDTKIVSRHIPPVTWRPIDQISAYWHHKWGVGAPDTWLWVGVPERQRLTGTGSLGDYYVGVLANAPLNDTISLYSQVTYMHPSASPGPAGAKEDQWNFFIGLALYPATNARTKTVAGRSWMPQLPVANNGTFLVDTSKTY